jgi:hypothetical protein
VIDFADDGARGLCPEERFWMGVIVLDVIVDGGLEFARAFEHAAANAQGGDVSKPALAKCKPRR